ncbi:putative lysis protein [Escherichia phage vB_EcoM_IME392]|nr:putative lysis protein [Escherichia phage vB_EcoM_IME392]
MSVTLDQLKKFLPTTSTEVLEKLLPAINTTIERYGINTNRRLRYFMAQTAFETRDYTKFVESLYYTSASRLVAVWPSRFTLRGEPGKLNANAYIRDPEKLANQVYANRMGNGTPASGDGYKYIGRGAMHLTGKANYREASLSIFGDDRLVEDPELVETDFETIMLTAGWFWDKNKLNQLADQDAFTKVTQKINGSAATVPDRLPVLRRANQTLTL